VRGEQGVLWGKKHKVLVLDWASKKEELIDDMGANYEGVVGHAATDKLGHS
jgi:hypothetical protein